MLADVVTDSFLVWFLVIVILAGIAWKVWR